MSKQLHLVTLLSQALLLEEEIFEEQDSAYETEFIKDFLEEQSFLREMKMTKTDTEPELKSQKKTILEKSTFKEIYRKIAAKTHPDKPTGKEKTFKDVQSAYQNHDVMKLISIAFDNDINISIKKEEVQQIECDIQDRKTLLEHRKNTLRWVWGVSDRGGVSRKIIRSAMQIDEAIFLEWLNKKN